MSHSVSIRDAFDDWMASRAPRKDSEHTKRAYYNDVWQIADIIIKQSETPSATWETFPLERISTRALRSAFASFSENRASSTIARAQSTWRGLCKFCVQEEWLQVDPMVGIVQAKVPTQLPKPLRGEEQTAAILLSWLAEGGRREGRALWAERDYAVIATLLLTGVRSAELRALTCGDIFGKPGEQRIRVLGKGRKERAIPVEAPLMKVIDEYLYSRQVRFPNWEQEDASFLFVDTNNEPLSPAQLRWIVFQCLRESGLGNTPQKGSLVHAMRATYATLIAAQGATAVEIMQLLGHESLDTSQGYIKAIASEVRRSAAANPLYRQLPSSEG